jgi:hypothetical protein
MTKKTVLTLCEVQLCCKAKAELQKEINEDLQQEDRCLAEILKEKEDENKNAKPK